MKKAILWNAKFKNFWEFYDFPYSTSVYLTRVYETLPISCDMFDDIHKNLDVLSAFQVMQSTLDVNLLGGEIIIVPHVLWWVTEGSMRCTDTIFIINWIGYHR
jgi:hypothetical protein